jgi:predicted enzyme related to lactoylglutathione lyase
MVKIVESYATLPAQDVKRARQFYEQKLGLAPAEVAPDGGALYRTGNSGFLVFQSRGKASGDHTQLGINVENLTAAVGELKKNGVTFEEYDFPGLKTENGIADEGNGNKVAWFKDTEGNLIGLSQRTTAATSGSASGRSATTNGN